MTTPSTEHVHFVALTIKEDLPPSAAFECRGNEDSPCHHYPDCECESWDDEHETDHPRVAHQECWLQGWFDGEGAVYSGEDATDWDEGLPREGMNKSGPIQAYYETEGYVSWDWAA